MTTLAAKYGPAPSVSADVAAGRLEAYARVSQAALEGRDGPLRAPALLLTDGQLAALFAPRQLATYLSSRFLISS